MTWIISSSFEAILTPKTMLDRMTGSLMKWCYMIIAMIVVMSTSFGLRSMENPDFVRNVREALFGNIMAQEPDYLDAASTGVLISRISENVVYVLNTYVDKPNNCVQFGMQAVAGIAIAFSLTWQVSLIGFSVLPMCMVIWIICGRPDQQTVGGIPRYINGDCCTSGGSCDELRDCQVVRHRIA
jgi:ABC-type multidrug transport system fused ATPase/permease subunit